MLLFYRRFFDFYDTFRVLSWVTGFLVFGSFISAVFCLIFTSSPVEAQWETRLPHTTIHAKDLWVAAGVINAILDLVISYLPQPLLWSSLKPRAEGSLVRYLLPRRMVGSKFVSV